MHRCVIVVPCYNEERRLPAAAFHDAVREMPQVSFLFVNDGSTDYTLEALFALSRADTSRLRVLDLPRNSGKAEAVRQGVLAALADSADLVGYWDADLATPLDAIGRYLEVFARLPNCEIVTGTRLPLLGRDIRRRFRRHVLGRVFSNVASRAVGLPIYDTQCGAKMFRATDTCRAAFSEPFLSRWIFDVELFARFSLLWQQQEGESRAASLSLRRQIYELPLEFWQDVDGSKLRGRDFARAIVELAGIAWRYRVQRRYEPSETDAGADTALPRRAA